MEFKRSKIGSLGPNNTRALVDEILRRQDEPARHEGYGSRMYPRINRALLEENVHIRRMVRSVSMITATALSLEARKPVAKEDKADAAVDVQVKKVDYPAPETVLEKKGGTFRIWLREIGKGFSDSNAIDVTVGYVLQRIHEIEALDPEKRPDRRYKTDYVKVLTAMLDTFAEKGSFTWTEVGARLRTSGGHVTDIAYRALGLYWDKTNKEMDMLRQRARRIDTP